MNYKEKLKRKASAASSEQASSSEAAARESAYAADVRRLAQDAGAGRVVFQSVAVTALQQLERALCHHRQAVEAALSLGQRQKLEEMTTALEGTAYALREALSTQGAQMLDLCAEPAAEHATEEGSWWFALTEAIEALEDGAQQVDSLAAGQPGGSTARQLGELVAGLLHRQHDDLLLEAEQWIS